MRNDIKEQRIKELEALKKSYELRWKSNLMGLLHEIADNSGGKIGIMKIPFNIVREQLIELAEMGLEIQDRRLDYLLLRLWIYEESDPSNPAHAEAQEELALYVAEYSVLKTGLLAVNESESALSRDFQRAVKGLKKTGIAGYVFAGRYMERLSAALQEKCPEVRVSTVFMFVCDQWKKEIAAILQK